MVNGKYTDDALRMTSDTTCEDIVAFIDRRITNPYVLNGKTVWNFSNHTPDMEGLEFSTGKKLEKETFAIPFEVTGTWALMYYLLPTEIRDAEILVYHNRYGDYGAYSNLLAEVSETEIMNIRSDFSGEVSQYCPE